MSTQLLPPPPLTDRQAAPPYLADPPPRSRRGLVALVAAVAVLWASSGLGYWLWSLVQPPTPCHTAMAPASAPVRKAGCTPSNGPPSTSSVGATSSQTGSSTSSQAGASSAHAGSSASTPAPLLGRYPTSPTQMTMGASGTVTLPAGWVGFLFSSPTLNADVANAFPGHPDVVSKLLQMIQQGVANHQTFVAMSNTGADASFSSVVAPNLSLASGAQTVISREIANGAHDLKVQQTTLGGLSAVRTDSTASVNLIGGGTATEHVTLFVMKDSMDRFYILTEHTPDLAHDQPALNSLEASVYIHGLKM